MMKKKAFAFALILLVVPIFSAIPIQAGKGQNKLSIRFELGGTGEGAVYGKVWNSPKKIEMPEYGRVTHIRGGDWGDSATHSGFMLIVDEDGMDIEINNDEITYSCTYEADFINKAYGTEELPYVIMNIRVRETWVIDADGFEGYIELLTVDKVTDYANLYEGIAGEGSFAGHGQINGQSVMVKGVSILEGVSVPYREGTVMGWPRP